MTELDGVVCIVTGANSGVGKSATTLLAERGATVHMICRNPRKGEAALAEIRRKAKSSGVHVHLADIAAVRGGTR